MLKAINYNIYFEEENIFALTNYFKETDISSIYILVDQHTKNNCLPIFLTQLPQELSYQVICIPFGENHKTLETCSSVWQQLTDLNADRKSILLNLGGGMLTDLGGFVASTFKRGIKFINISTTLLGMVDASVGGKTGIDFNNLKNQIGLFSNPEMVLIHSNFLKTLPKRELVSGMAEIIKYAITYDESLWKSMLNNPELTTKNLQNWIYESIKIKNEIVLKDPKEQNLRKILNYGHTIGHAIETHFLSNPNKKNLTHGEAIAIGLVVETYISHKQLNFPKEKLLELKTFINSIFKQERLLETDYPSFFELMKHDKKNINNVVLFTLLNNVANHKLNCKVNEDLIIEALNFYSI